LAGGVPDLHFHLFPLQVEGSDFEVHADRWQERLVENVLRKTQQ
jgi:hypothetical protein